MPVSTQCELLGLSRSPVYYRPRGIAEGDLLLMRRIDELHLEHPFLGARKLARLLQDEGYALGRRHVGRLMRRMGIEPIYRKPRTTCRIRRIASTPTCCPGWWSSVPTKSGPVISPTCPWRVVLFTWWRSWTCTAVR